MWEILKNTEFNPFFDCSFTTVLQKNKANLISLEYFDYLVNGNSTKRRRRNGRGKRNCSPEKTQESVNCDHRYTPLVAMNHGCMGTPYCDCYRNHTVGKGDVISYKDGNRMDFQDYLDHFVFGIQNINIRGIRTNLQNVQNECHGTPYCDCTEKLGRKQKTNNVFDRKLLSSVQRCILENNKLKEDLQKLRFQYGEPDIAYEGIEEPSTSDQILHPISKHNSRRRRSIWTETADTTLNDTNEQENDHSNDMSWLTEPCNPCDFFQVFDDGKKPVEGRLDVVEETKELHVPYSVTVCPGSVFCDC